MQRYAVWFGGSMLASQVRMICYFFSFFLSNFITRATQKIFFVNFVLVKSLWGLVWEREHETIFVTNFTPDFFFFLN